MKPGPRNLITDVEGFLVGNAADAALKSGTTVLTAEEPFVAAVQVVGGAPGTRETDLLAPDRLVEKADALVLSGDRRSGSTPRRELRTPSPQPAAASRWGECGSR